jgi:hypothetical protein
MIGDRDESRTIRARAADAADTIDRSPQADVGANAARTAQTVTVATYPTVAHAVYAVKGTTVDVPETEGAIPVFTQVAGVFYAVNLGTAIPPVGANILVTRQGGRWTFTY